MIEVVVVPLIQFYGNAELVSRVHQVVEVITYVGRPQRPVIGNIVGGAGSSGRPTIVTDRLAQRLLPWFTRLKNDTELYSVCALQITVSLPSRTDGCQTA